MLQHGLIPVLNPSEVLVSDYEENLSGVAVACMVRGASYSTVPPTTVSPVTPAAAAGRGCL